MDYKSDTNLKEDVESKTSTLMCDNKSRRTANPFPDYGAADAPRALRVTPDDTRAMVITNSLGEYQQRLVEKEDSARPRSMMWGSI